MKLIDKHPLGVFLVSVGIIIAAVITLSFLLPTEPIKEYPRPVFQLEFDEGSYCRCFADGFSDFCRKLNDGNPEVCDCTNKFITGFSFRACEETGHIKGLNKRGCFYAGDLER